MPKKHNTDPAISQAVASIANATMRKHEGDIARGRERLQIAKAERAVREIVDAAPPLSQEQRNRLATMLRAGRA